MVFPSLPRALVFWFLCRSELQWRISAASPQIFTTAGSRWRAQFDTEFCVVRKLTNVYIHPIAAHFILWLLQPSHTVSYFFTNSCRRDKSLTFSEMIQTVLAVLILAIFFSIVDDYEMYDQQKPFSLEDQTALSGFLNTLTYKLLWNRPRAKSEKSLWENFVQNSKFLAK